MLRLRLVGMLAAAATAAAGIPVLVAAPAHAAAYRYWSYWHGNGGSWSFSQVGAGSWRVQDGSVEGWHFAVSPNTRSAPPPRYAAATAFDQLCGKVPKATGKVRVALVLDFGVAGDYPDGDAPPDPGLVGDCVTVPQGSTGIAVLNTADVAVRDQGGMVCALAGHPVTGCGEFVPDPTPTPTRSQRPTRSPRPTASATPKGTGRHATGTTGPTAGATTAAASTAPGADGRTQAPQTPPPSATSPAAAGPPAPSDPGPPTSAPADAAAAPDASPTLVVGMPVASSTGTGTPWPAVAVLVGVAGLAAASYWWRRRSS